MRIIPPLIIFLFRTLLYNNQLISENVSSFSLIENFIFYTKNKVLNIYNLDDNSNEIKLFPFPSNEFQNGKFLNISNSELDLVDNNYSYLINTFSFPDGQKLTTSKKKYKIGYGIWKDPTFFFNTTEIEIRSLHLPTETTLWQFSVAELGADKVSRILGVFGQVLAVVCKMPKNPIPILVGLDITDGSKLFTVQLPLYQMNNNLFFYEANNSIVSIIGEYLWEYSLSTFQVIREKYLPEVFNTEDVHIQVYLATLQGDTIYFAASEFGKSMSSAIVGIFDLKKEQLIDYIDLKPNGKFCMGGNSCPQVSGNKIYVLDTKKTLHILEREDG